jgi:predicted ATP-dependent serine protease
MVYNKRQYRKCQKCGWEWVANKESLQCPNCRTFKWEKENELIKNIGADKSARVDFIKNNESLKNINKTNVLKLNLEELKQLKKIIDDEVKRIMREL